MFIKNFKSITIDEKSRVQPDIRPIWFQGKEVYQQHEDFSFRYRFFYKGRNYTCIITAKKGFICDGQSGPKFSWSFGFRPDGLVRLAALVHDILYRTMGGSKHIKGLSIECIDSMNPIFFSRKACDQLYKLIYKDSAPFFKRKYKLGYFILRMFGRKHFGGPVPALRE